MNWFRLRGIWPHRAACLRPTGPRYSDDSSDDRSAPTSRWRLGVVLAGSRAPSAGTVGARGERGHRGRRTDRGHGLAMAAWLGGGSGSATDAFRAGVIGWLAGQGSGVNVSQTSVTA